MKRTHQTALEASAIVDKPSKVNMPIPLVGTVLRDGRIVWLHTPVSVRELAEVVIDDVGQEAA